jgi:6-phosphogluconolactonase
VHGELRIVDDVATAFADLVTDLRPSSLALSGGGTARAAYAALADLDHDWADTEVFCGDERWVPTTDDDSNEGMARAVLLDHVQPRAVHSLRDAGTTIDEAALAYDALVGSVPPIGLVHLGLGPDGHTASLFPDSTALAVRDRLVVANGDDLHPHPRLTFTYPALERARVVVFTVAGDGKRDAFGRVRAGADVPAAHVTGRAVIWLVDVAAAG